MPDISNEISYFDAAGSLMAILGHRILAEAFKRSKFIRTVHRNWDEHDPRRRDDILFIQEDVTVRFFEFAYAFSPIKMTVDYAKKVNIGEVVEDMAETIDRTISATLFQDSKIEDCTFYSRPFPDPTAEMEQFGLHGRIKSVQDRDMGFTILFTWDFGTFAPRIELRFLCGAYTPNPWIAHNPSQKD